MEIKDIVKEIKKEGMRCNCDLDSWQPYQDTGHSWVCRIDREARRRFEHLDGAEQTPVIEGELERRESLEERTVE
jgi:hypothetical protein